MNDELHYFYEYCRSSSLIFFTIGIRIISVLLSEEIVVCLRESEKFDSKL